MLAADVIAKVGGVPITAFELQREINEIMPMLVSFHGKVSQEKYTEIKQQALDNLIERGYKVCYAEQNDLTVPDAQIDTAIESVRQKMKADDFKRAVASETLAGLRASVSRGILAQIAETKAVDEQISLTDEQVLDYYSKHKKGYFRPLQFRASHILIKVDPALIKAEKDALRVQAEVLLERAHSGEDFFQLAYYNSMDRTKYVGGDLGFFHEGQTVPEFEAALKKLKVGEVSGLIKTLYGYHIAKLTELNQPRQLDFAEVEDKIRQQMLDMQRAQLYSAWIEPLKNDCKLDLVQK